MALTRQLSRFGLATVDERRATADRPQSLLSLSQRKLNALGLPLAYVDGARRYRFVNKAFLEWSSKTFSEVIGQEVANVMGRDIFPLYEAYVEAALAGEHTGFEQQLSARGHPMLWIRVDYYPDRGQDGDVRGFVVTYADVDQLKRLELEAGWREHRLRLITDSVGSPIVHFDRNLKVRFANKPFGAWIGMAPDDLLGRDVQELIAGGAFSEMNEDIERAFDGAKVSLERRERKATGELRWVRITLFPDRAIGGHVSGVFAVMADIDDDIAIRDALKAQEVQLRLFADNIPGPIAYLDRAATYTFVNQAFATWVRKPQDEIYGRSPFEVLAPDVATFLRPVLERAQSGEHVEYERIGATPSGERRWVHGRVAPDLDAGGKLRGLYCTEYDIHDLKESEEALRRANWMLSSHISNTPLAVLEWDRDFRLIRWSPQAERIFGWRADEVLGMPFDGNPLLHEAERGVVAELLGRLMSGEEPRATGLTRNSRKGGQTIWCEWYHSCLLDDQGTIVSILSFVQDVSLRIQAEERLQHMATRDALTGLPNRLMLQERLGQAIAHAKRKNCRVGVLFIDLDRFKNVNDTLGHRIGDELLKAVSGSLGSALRESDLLARLGGDEFMVVVEDFDEPATLGRVAQKLLDAVAQPFRIEEHDLYVTSSIGISVFPDDSEDPEQLLKHADVAMYRSKELGRNTYQFLDAEFAQQRVRQHTLESALRMALKDGLLRLHYQPIVNISDGAIIGAEALLRWNDAEHGSISPTVFIELAEESGLIHALGDWVLRSAALQCAAWRRAGLMLTVSVNLSARQFYRDDIAHRISEIVRGAGCEPSWIELEVTETSLLHDLDAIRKTLELLRTEGFTVAIDDFGTGYSSLTHLKHFPIDTLKIDISFIADLETDPGDAAITEAIIGLARGLGLKVVAEGVGTQAQLDFLAAHGCHCFQGFWVSRPVPVDEFERLVNGGNTAGLVSTSKVAAPV